MRIAVLGAGAWGTSLAISLSSHSNANSSHQVILWTRNASHLAELDAQRSNKRYFPAFPLPESLRLTSSLFTAIEAADTCFGYCASFGTARNIAGNRRLRKNRASNLGVQGIRGASPQSCRIRLQRRS